MCSRSENVSTVIWIWFHNLFSFHGQNNPSPCPSRSIMCVNEALKPGSSLSPVAHLLMINRISLPQLLDSSKIEKEPWRYLLPPVSRQKTRAKTEYFYNRNGCGFTWRVPTAFSWEVQVQPSVLQPRAVWTEILSHYPSPDRPSDMAVLFWRVTDIFPELMARTMKTYS